MSSPSDIDAVIEPSLKPERKLAYISDDSSDNWDIDADESFSLAHISSKFALAMLDESAESSPTTTSPAHVSNGGGDSTAPVHGSPVALIGRASFPCVCEVPPASASLFSGRTCIANEGIRW